MNLESLELTPFESGAEDSRPAVERRLHQRIRLRWPLSILKETADSDTARVVTTVTENLSSRGFWCVLDETLAAGEHFACILDFPCRRDPEPECQALRCQAQVVWVRTMADGRFGIGCRIDDYTVVA